ncbi:hypothetical protein AAF712_014089 [Marasmius tenuissimus]|uniref:Transposase n=1 Tax=Marasmius tenuissimus TaxID=585030 RepID=A0ABR2ZD47_9AGAR
MVYTFVCTLGCFIDDDWELIEGVPEFKPLEDKEHEGYYGGKAFVNGASASLTTDNATVNNVLIKTVARSLLKKYDVGLNNDRQIRCVAHIMNLVVQDILHTIGEADDPDVVDYFKLHQDMSFHYNPQEDVDQLELESEQDRKDIFLDDEEQIDEDLIDDLVDDSALKRAIDLWVFETKKMRPCTLSERDWQLLEAIADILEPYENLTKLMSRSSQPTLPFVPLVYQEMEVHLTKMAATSPHPQLCAGAESGLKKLNKYFGIAKKNRYYVLGTVLHPSMHTSWFENYFYLSQDAAEELVTHVAQTYLDDTGATLPENTASTPNPTTVKSRTETPTFLTRMCSVNIPT